MKCKLTKPRSNYKPFQYEWAYEAYIQSEQMHWLSLEVPMVQDVKDWKTKLTESEKQFLTHVFRFFVQADIDVAGAYISNYLPVFPHPEIRLMLTSFAAREATHISGYSYLIETLGLPEVIYSEFLDYKEMRDKHEYTESFVGKDSRTIVQQIAVFSAFTEGLQLFSSFVMLLNFSRFGKMKGMGQIINWSIADESLHCEAMTKLFREFIKENPIIWDDSLKREIYTICRKMVELEDAFIDLAFGINEMEGLNKEELKLYIRYIADRRLIGLGMQTEYNIRKNPLPWVDGMLGISHGNFFEGKVIAYAKGATVGSWGSVWK